MGAAAHILAVLLGFGGPLLIGGAAVAAVAGIIALGGGPLLLNLITSRLAGPLGLAAAIALAVMLAAANGRLGVAQADAAGWRKAADAWKGASIAWHANALGWEASFYTGETRRGVERITADGAAQALTDQFTARLDEARRSASAIGALVHKEPPYDAQHCPVRGLLDPGQLRDALQPPAAAHAR